MKRQLLKMGAVIVLGLLYQPLQLSADSASPQPTSSTVDINADKYPINPAASILGIADTQIQNPSDFSKFSADMGDLSKGNYAIAYNPFRSTTPLTLNELTQYDGLTCAAQQLGWVPLGNNLYDNFNFSIAASVTTAVSSAGGTTISAQNFAVGFSTLVIQGHSSSAFRKIVADAQKEENTLVGYTRLQHTASNLIEAVGYLTTTSKAKIDPKIPIYKTQAWAIVEGWKAIYDSYSAVTSVSLNLSDDDGKIIRKYLTSGAKKIAVNADAKSLAGFVATYNALADAAKKVELDQTNLKLLRKELADDGENSHLLKSGWEMGLSAGYGLQVLGGNWNRTNGGLVGVWLTPTYMADSGNGSILAVLRSIYDPSIRGSYFDAGLRVVCYLSNVSLSFEGIQRHYDLPTLVDTNRLAGIVEIPVPTFNGAYLALSAGKDFINVVGGNPNLMSKASLNIGYAANKIGL